MKRNKIIVYTDLLDCVSLLDNEQLGQIFKALLQLSESKEIEIEDLIKRWLPYLRVIEKISLD